MPFALTTLRGFHDPKLWLAALALTACVAESEESTNDSTAASEADAATETAQHAHAEPTTAASAADAGSISDTEQAPGGACTRIAVACEAFELVDDDGLGGLCLSVIGTAANLEVCEAVEDECSTFCRSEGNTGIDAGAYGAEECDEMGDRCHDLDTGEGLGHLCHETGHRADATWCAAIYDECSALCPGLEPHDESEQHTSDSSGPDAG